MKRPLFMVVCLLAATTLSFAAGQEESESGLPVVKMGLAMNQMDAVVFGNGK